MTNLPMVLTLGTQATRVAVMWTVNAGLVMLTLGVLACLYRLARGPHLADRAMALDTLGIHVIGGVVLLGIRIGTLMFVDGILVLSLLGFAGTVAMAQYIAGPYYKSHPDKPASTERSV